MSSTVHPQQEKLLELAYGELSSSDAKRIELHLQACARCAEALSSIRRVRQTMSQLPAVQAPERGMESLLAYAEQAARRARSGPGRVSSWWSRLMVPAAGAIALAAVVVVGIRVTKQVNLSPAAEEERRLELAHRSPIDVRIKARAEMPESKPTSAAKSAMTDKSEANKLLAAKTPSPEAVEQRNSSGAGAALRQIAAARELSSDTAANKDVAPGAQGDAFAAGKEPPSEALYKRSASKPLSPPAGVGQTTPERNQLSRAEAQAGRRDEPSDRPAQAPGKKQAAAAERGTRVGGVEGGVEGGVPAGVLGGVAGSPMGIVNGEAVSSAQQEKAAASAEPAHGKGAEQGATMREVSDDATKAKEAGDRRREVAQLKQALAAGATGQYRADLLNRLCDALFAIGEPVEAASTCDQVVREFPNSQEAVMALRRKDQNDVSRAKAKAESSAPASVKGKQQPGN